MTAPRERGLPQEAYLRPKEGFPTPVQMAKQTANALGMYVRDLPGRSAITPTVLREQTVPYLNGAERGMARSIRRFTKTRTLSAEEMDRMLAAFPTHEPGHDPHDHEAFDFAVVVFAMMPDETKIRQLPQGFSRRGVLAPPFTTGEFLARIREMRGEVAKILVGQTDPGITLAIDHPLWRTYAFFHTARQLPDMYRENPVDILYRSRNAFEQLLDDVQVDL